MCAQILGLVGLVPRSRVSLVLGLGLGLGLVLGLGSVYCACGLSIHNRRGHSSYVLVDDAVSYSRPPYIGSS